MPGPSEYNCMYDGNLRDSAVTVKGRGKCVFEEEGNDSFVNYIYTPTLFLHLNICELGEILQ